MNLQTIICIGGRRHHVKRPDPFSIESLEKGVGSPAAIWFFEIMAGLFLLKRMREKIRNERTKLENKRKIKFKDKRN